MDKRKSCNTVPFVWSQQGNRKKIVTIQCPNGQARLKRTPHTVLNPHGQQAVHPTIFECNFTLGVKLLVGKLNRYQYSKPFFDNKLKNMRPPLIIETLSNRL